MKKSKNIKTPPTLFNETQKLVELVSEMVDGDFITYWVAAKSSIVGDDTITFYELCKNKSNKDNLYLFLKSDGGSGEASLRIVSLLRKYYKKVIVLIPFDCASAATMLALGADLIKMGPLSYLTSIDTSITHDLSPIDKDNDRVSVSQNELSRVLNLWDKNSQKSDTNPFVELYKYIHPLVIGSVDRATSLSIKLTTEILSYHLEDLSKAEEISNTLNSNYPSHSFPITIQEAKKIGLNVVELEIEVNNLLLKLNALYSEMAQLAYTDFDERNYHDNEILKVIEGKNLKMFFQKDKDWHYRTEERTWVPLNDNSSWHRMEKLNGKIQESSFYIN